MLVTEKWLLHSSIFSPVAFTKWGPKRNVIIKLTLFNTMQLLFHYALYWGPSFTLLQLPETHSLHIREWQLGPLKCWAKRTNISSLSMLPEVRNVLETTLVTSFVIIKRKSAACPIYFGDLCGCLDREAAEHLTGYWTDSSQVILFSLSWKYCTNNNIVYAI